MRKEVYIYRQRLYGEEQTTVTDISEYHPLDSNQSLVIKLRQDSKCKPFSVETEQLSDGNQTLKLSILGEVEIEHFKKALQLWLDSFPVENANSSHLEDLIVEVKNLQE